jgi:ferredoxin/nitrate reductase gamma subunit
MDFKLFIEGPLLRFAFLVLIMGSLARLAFFFVATRNGRGDKSSDSAKVWASAGRLLVPLHRALIKKPIFTVVRYLFHICLIVTPIWLAGHVSIWEMSAFEFSWAALPDSVADVMTLTVIGLCVLFFFRRMLFPEVRRKSSLFDFLFLILCLLPFLSGYLLLHGTLDSNVFFSNNLLLIHILTACVLMVAMVFIFLCTRLDIVTCTGCGACEMSCPTKTIESIVSGVQRVFYYAHYQCVACGSCVAACPENAAELRHEVGFKKMFQVRKKQTVRSVELSKCSKCGQRFAPEPQVAELGKKIAGAYLHLCPQCRMISLVYFQSYSIAPQSVNPPNLKNQVPDC